MQSSVQIPEITDINIQHGWKDKKDRHKHTTRMERQTDRHKTDRQT